MGERINAWTEATLAGFLAMSEADLAGAADRWLDAREALRRCSMPSDMPLWAAAQTNAGTASLLLEATGDAVETLADSEQRWARLLRRAATADVPISGRSSAFHFRLASRNLAAFQNAQRHRFVRLCEAGLAITRFNRLHVSAGRSACAAVASTLACQLADLLGPRSLEVRLLRAAMDPSSETVTADSIYADKVVALDTGRAPTPEAQGGDWRWLDVAVRLTVLLPPDIPLSRGAGLSDDFEAGQVNLPSTR